MDRSTSDNDSSMIISQNPIIGNAVVDGNNTSVGQEHESQDAIGGDISLGAGGDAKPILGLGPDADVRMNLVDIEKRFVQDTKARHKETGLEKYLEYFRRFFYAMKLEQYTKRQLATKLGRQLILDFIDTIPKGIRRSMLSMLKDVWTYGLGLDWPIVNKRDIGRLPSPKPQTTPPNAPIKEWAETVGKENDAYLRLVWLLIAQTGWRPSHVTGIRWSDVQYDDQSRPSAIIAVSEDFKTYAAVAVHLSPDVIQALEEWSNVHPAPNGDAWWLPYRGMTKDAKVDVARKMTTEQLENHWLALEKKYLLPHLTPKNLRHWVSTQCRKAGLSRRASAYLQGHDPDGGHSMRDWYDNVQLEEIFQEQADVFPRGPLAAVLPVTVELVIDYPPEALASFGRLLSREIDSSEFLDAIKPYLRKIERIEPGKVSV